MNFTQMVTLFASKMAGGSDDDDVILASFEAFEQDGKIDAEAFRHSLMTFGKQIGYYGDSTVMDYDDTANVCYEFVVDMTGKPSSDVAQLVLRWIYMQSSKNGGNITLQAITVEVMDDALEKR